MEMTTNGNDTPISHPPRSICGVVWTERDTANLFKWALRSDGFPFFRVLRLSNPSRPPKPGSEELDSCTPRSDIGDKPTRRRYEGSRRGASNHPRWGEYAGSGEVSVRLLLDDKWVLVGDYQTGKVWERKDRLGRLWIASESPTTRGAHLDFVRYTTEEERKQGLSLRQGALRLTKLQYLALFTDRVPLEQAGDL